MISALFLGAVTGLATQAGESVRYVDASLELSDELLGARFVDIDGDERLELCMAVRARKSGQRELRLHRLGPEGIEPVPYRSVPVLDDVVIFGLADVRAEAGRELVLMTRSGAWSYSLEREGYRGNVERLVETPLLFDVPEPRALPFWDYVLPRSGGDWLLFAGPDGGHLWGPPAAEAEQAPGEAVETGETVEPGGEPGAYRRRLSFPGVPAAARGVTQRDQRRTRRQRSEVSVGGGGFAVTLSSGLAGELFVAEEGDGGSSGALLMDSRSYRAPALADVDGDGRNDLLVWTDGGLRVHLARDGGPGPQPDRTEPFPPVLVPAGPATVRVELVDLDQDGDADVIGTVQEEVDGFENAAITVAVFVNDGERLLAPEPDQILRFEAAIARVEVADVDGDGRADLVVREFKLPSVTATITGLSFELTHLLFLGDGEGGRPFQRKPALKEVERFDESTVQTAMANRRMSHDCDGDGIADLVEVDWSGRIAIRRLQRHSSFLGGTSWRLDREPWKRFDVRGSIEALRVEDLNGDGLGDVVSRGEKTLTVLLSARGVPGGGR